MDKLIHAIAEYAQDTENAEKNYQVAMLYESIGQYAAAVSFFLRASERTDDKNLAYECLLKVALCYDRHANRHNTVRGIYKHAITFLPKRPEAYYFLAKFDNFYQNFPDGYLIAQLGLEFADFDSPKLRDEMEYLGKPGLIFEKAVASWWWGKGQETRKLFRYLIDNHYREMPDRLIVAIQENIARIGSGPDSQAVRTYKKENYKHLRFQFTGSENVERNYSQVYQDMFILSMLNGKRNGTYLEIGSCDPYHNNNTALLEQQFDWVGTGVEIDAKYIPAHIAHRKNKVLCHDATKINYDVILSELARDGVVDYLQLDCEPAKTTFETLLNIPFDKYKFAVITYEHDYYVDVTRTFRTKSRNYLKSLGYVLVVNDISTDGISNFEDWWVHPELIDKDILDKMTFVTDSTKHVEDYMLSNK
jgi:hypothetical protein